MSEQPPCSQCSSILLVEDHVPLLRSMAFLLEVAGFTVYTATDGDEALRHMARRRPDLIISDIDLPGMTGYDLLQAIRTNRRWRSIPLIFASHRFGLDDVLRALDMGANGYLPKPFDFSDLLGAIDDVFPQRAGEQLRPSA